MAKPAGYEPCNLDDRPVEEVAELAVLYAALAHYAMETTVAKTLRLEGRVSAAIRREVLAENIYKSLPEWARW